jgi:excisionase family DNA binding protein
MSRPVLRPVSAQRPNGRQHLAADARQAEVLAHELAVRLEMLASEIAAAVDQLWAGDETRRTAPAVMLTVEETAESLRVSRTVVFNLIKSGTLRSVRIGGSRRIPAAALTEYAESLSEE